MDRDAYIHYLKAELRKERKTSQTLMSVNIVISLAAIALLCMLTIATNMP